MSHVENSEENRIVGYQLAVWVEKRGFVARILDTAKNVITGSGF